jgi:hypothetical protein
MSFNLSLATPGFPDSGSTGPEEPAPANQG